MRSDPRMIGYFMLNEPHWAFVNVLNLTEQMLQSLVRFASKYEWFEDLHKARSSEWPDNPGRKEDFAAFNRVIIRRYVEVPAMYCKQADPNHLNLGMRYAWVGSDDVLEGCEAIRT